MRPDRIALPDIPALCVNGAEAALLSAEGEVKTLSPQQARLILHEQPVLLCHAPYVKARLGHEAIKPFDVLELFAFVHPTLFTVPTPAGLCKALGLSCPDAFEDMPAALFDITQALLKDLQTSPVNEKADPLKIAAVMGAPPSKDQTGWAWTPFIFSALGADYDPALPPGNSRAGLNVWKTMREWAEDPPEPPPSHHGVTKSEALSRLADLLGPDAEKRPQQVQYAAAACETFAPVDDEDKPHVVLLEAGTGVGKTLGYLAPASVWAEKNKGSVWVSTFTKNLQRQIEKELDRLYPNPDLKETHVAVRKGRENYLCLLNLEDAAAGVQTARDPRHAIAAGLMTRWAASSKDGDLSGGSFPGWLPGLAGFHQTTGLADRRGECLYSACDHYRKCFVEHSMRKAKRARLVVANHALVMIQTALAGPEDATLPARYVFDEAHHLFSAADSAFAAHLTMRETAELRRWLLGMEGGKSSRARGLKRRLEDLIAGDEQAERCLQDIVQAAHVLAAPNWSRRLKDGAPIGTTELFLAALYRQVQARADGREGPYSLETPAHPLSEEIAPLAHKLKNDLESIEKPIKNLTNLLLKKLADDQGMMEPETRRRLDAIASSLERRARMSLKAWISMLDSLLQGETPGEFIDWMEVERVDGHAVDVGLYRHYVDPMKPFAAALKPHMHGMTVTSATLRDSTGDEGQSWENAQMRTGAAYLDVQPHMEEIASPFDYAAQTRIFVIDDVNKTDAGQVAGAYRTLFEASGGGALGLFTAISRLRAVHKRIANPLEQAGLPLYAQHVDEIDSGTLVDMFRDDTQACLLGTDAIRDGVDVPGESLRLIVFDRVPWPRPTILHKARREAFGGRAYDDMITRLKLKQAFGRLIRRATDKGVFVMLDGALPSKLHSAFPETVKIQKLGLKDASALIRDFLG